MPRDAQGVAREWLEVASGDLAGAELMLGNPSTPRQASYLAQQCVEKALKALLSSCNTPFPKTHDLTELVALLAPDSGIHALDIDWPTLTEWAVRGRYPGTGPAAMTAEAVIAVESARRVLSLVQAEIC